MKNLTIDKKKKLPKKKVKSVDLNIDFTFIKELSGNKELLDYMFSVTKIELLNNQNG